MTSQRPLHEMRATTWAITMWLTEGRTVETLQQLTQGMPEQWHLEGQIEQGHDTDDKLHAQLLLKTPQTRGKRIQKHFPNCHIDEARNRYALQNYVHKSDTRVAEFKTVENRSPQWSVVCSQFFDWLVRRGQSMHANEEEKYLLWDEFIGLCIEEGMRVDVIGVNPQYRSCIQRYWKNYFRVSLINYSPPIDEEVVIPTPVDKIDKTDKFHVRSPPP